LNAPLHRASYHPPPLTPLRPQLVSRPRPTSTAGFSLLELSVVVFIISVLATLAVPAIRKVNLEARSTTVVNDLRVYAAALQTYAQEKGDWPDAGAAPGEFPHGMDGYLGKTNWERVTPIGGLYTWSPNTMQAGERHRAAIVISSVGDNKVSIDHAQLTDLDKKIDDGVFDTGTFRLGFRNYPVYVLEH
jgi:prepilin-type N-terminal cleavage/methylation domain-containing protein